MVFDPIDATLCCETPWCAALGMPVSLWRAQQRRAASGHGTDGTPAGLPRPRMAGRPDPWITPVTDGQPWWRLTHGERVLACQTDWLCQVCGTRLADQAWVITQPDGPAARAVVTNSAMHHACLTIAQRACPALADTVTYRPVRVTRADIDADGIPLPQAPTPLQQQTWTLQDR
jgi:hypothetical protein